MFIRQRTRDEKTGKIKIKRDQIPIGKAFGLNPTKGEGKLKAIGGTLLPEVNFGVALVHEPIVVRHQRVWGTIATLKDMNGGRLPQILRRSDLIRVTSGMYAGIWRVASIKDNHNGISIDVVRPNAVKITNGVTFAKVNVLIKTLMKNGLEVLKSGYTGVALCHTT